MNGVTTVVSFGVQVQGAPVNDTFTVSIGGVDVGQFTTTPQGTGGLLLCANPQGPPQQPLPANFPTGITAGTTITLTDSSGNTTLSGALIAAPTTPPVNSNVALVAQLTGAGTTATGIVQFNQSVNNNTTITTLSVQVQGATPDDTFSVTVDSVVVGQFTTDPNGNGGLVLSSNPMNAQQQPLPANFPTGIAVGTSVSLTDTGGNTTISGTLAVPPTTPPPPPSGGQPGQSGTVLMAQLSGTGTTATGNVQFNQFTTGTSQTVTTLCIQVQGATPDDTFSVTIGGVVVGQFTTDANGNGGLVLSSDPQGPPQQALPSNFPTDIALGTIVSLTDTSGDTTLAGTLVGPTSVPPGGGAQPGIALTAQLTGADATTIGLVQYNQTNQNGTTVTTFCVQVQGGAANDTFSVTLDDVVVGQFTTDANGDGGLVLSSDPQGSQQALPTDFPTGVIAGTSVSVTDTAGTTTLAGTLSTANPPPQPGQGTGGQPQPVANGTCLSAQLTGTPDTAIGAVQLNQATQNGVTNTLFVVQITAPRPTTR